MTSKTTRQCTCRARYLLLDIHRRVCAPFPGESQRGGLKHLSRPGFPLPPSFDARLST